MTIKWQTREAWEQNQLAKCWQDADERATKLSDFATAAQIADAMRKLRERWKELGRQLRATTDHQERVNIRGWRRDINDHLKDMQNDEIPIAFIAAGIEQFDLKRRTSTLSFCLANE